MADPLWTPADEAMAKASWDDLRVFLSVVSTGSLSKAARALDLTQPTVGRRLDRLEQAFGVPLVRRTSRGCDATERGALLLPLVERMSEAADGVIRVAATATNDLAGVVRVAVGDLLARYIARHLPELLAGAPQLRVEIVASRDFVNLERGEADLAMRTRAPKGENWVAKPVGRTHFAVYGAPAYVDAHADALDEERRWAGCTWISFDESQSTSSSEYLRQRRGRPSEVGFSSSLLILEAAACGAGLALLPTWIGDDDPRLRCLSGPLDGLGLPWFLVVHPSARRLPRVRWVASRLARLLDR
jgi:DNA-binding transcriptional LysR family regulator